MTNAVIGAHRVNLGTDSAQFSSGLKKSQGSLAAFAKSATVSIFVMRGVTFAAFAFLAVVLVMI